MRLQKKWTALTVLLFGFVFFMSSGDMSAQIDLKKQAQKVEGFAKLDANKDGKISKDEFMSHAKAEFESKDVNKDGKIQKKECGKFDQFNTNGDDTVSPEEFLKGHEDVFAKMDANKDGSVSKDEFKAAKKPAMKKGKCGDGKCGGGK